MIIMLNRNQRNLGLKFKVLSEGGVGNVKLTSRRKQDHLICNNVKTFGWRYQKMASMNSWIGPNMKFELLSHISC